MLNLLLFLTSALAKIEGKTVVVVDCAPSVVHDALAKRLPKRIADMTYHDWTQAINEQWCFKKRNGKTVRAIRVVTNNLVRFDDNITRYMNGSVWSTEISDTDIVGIHIIE